MRQLLRTLFALALLGGVAAGVYLEAGAVTAGVVVVLFLGVAGLDRRTRSTEDPLEAVKRMVEELGAGSGEEEGNDNAR